MSRVSSTTMKVRRSERGWLIVETDQIQNSTRQYIIAAPVPN
jgi:hypothetical protein